MFFIISIREENVNFGFFKMISAIISVTTKAIDLKKKTKTLLTNLVYICADLGRGSD